MVIVGPGAAGKSTLAARLSKITGLPVILLDQHFWRPGLAATPADQWADIERGLAARQSWIMDGDLGPYEAGYARFRAADMVVFLDFSPLRCTWRAIRRSRERADFWHWLWAYRRRTRPMVRRALAEQAGHADLYVLSGPRAVRRFVGRAASEVTQASPMKPLSFRPGPDAIIACRGRQARMAIIIVSAERAIDAPTETVYGYFADMRVHHPRFLPPAFSDFQVESGGVGAGTVTRFKVTAGGRTRDYRMTVAEPEPGRVLTESDTASSLITKTTVTPRGSGCIVEISTTWDGAGGIGGFFERVFAPRVMRGIYEDELRRLEAYARQQADA